ncbi:ATP-binding protein [Metamycoplasma auris]|uniref:ATPase family protein associated with various cellular activities (AAA) n=1 Tax=Metamycoplasma auris TaxID=51363 RepID=A0A2W7G4D4_9BACT|nr:ATP-binding protein [Metamycoplasma auris]PZV99954.1 ATPase family protein associated with various cellular activities (AAA) [Metamycoplasma auris]
MKKSNILNLIKYHIEENDIAFRKEAYLIAEEFYKMNDDELGEYIFSMLRGANYFVPQLSSEISIPFAQKVELEVNLEPLPLPKKISEDIQGIIHAIRRGASINKFLFQGPPGTGKTESVKQIARILNRDLFIIDSNSIIDSHLGQTGKNISELFNAINGIVTPEKIIVCFDEIDALALERVDQKDVREMGRVTTSILKALDNLNDNIIIIATTNLFKHFDKALSRRFDLILNFNKYQRQDLIEISEVILKHYLKKVSNIKSDLRLFRKIVSLMNEIPLPGELKNIIKSALYLSDPNDEHDYLKRFYKQIVNEPYDLKKLKEHNFTVREIEILTGISKSNVALKLKGE